MAFVFGQTLICADNASANLVAWDNDVKLYSVSLEGSVYDPSGVLTGGSSPSGNGILVKVQRIKEVERQLADKQTLLYDIVAEENGGRKARRDTWKRLVRELEIKEHEVSLLEQQVGGSNAAKVRILRTRPAKPSERRFLSLDWGRGRDAKEGNHRA